MKKCIVSFISVLETLHDQVGSLEEEITIFKTQLNELNEFDDEESDENREETPNDSEYDYILKTGKKRSSPDSDARQLILSVKERTSKVSQEMKPKLIQHDTTEYKGWAAKFADHLLEFFK